MRQNPSPNSEHVLIEKIGLGYWLVYKFILLRWRIDLNELIRVYIRNECDHKACIRHLDISFLFVHPRQYISIDVIIL